MSNQMPPFPKESENESREEQLFAAALNQPAGERRRFLAEHCGADEALARRLAMLLGAHDTAGSFLETPPVRRRATTGLETLGDQVGVYRIVRLLGEGGCGVVYLAEQREPLRREVALKVVKPGMDTREVIARFESERQALAWMDHPNIARVYDAGATAAGRPYFVMEVVPGPRLTAYCDTRGASVATRVDLLLEVCDALAHAHQKGVAHRDIKPSNLLMSAPGDGARPKVIDFGVAKAMQGRPGDDPTMTTPGGFVGTPAYMSPEQAAGANDVDTRTDIYSLGALLYELLTGAPPFGSGDVAPAELLRRVREEEPVRPAAALRALAAPRLATVAARRGTDPAGLLREVRGDLDWIVLRCLEKDPARRYATVEGMAADLRRYRQDLPVEARPPSAAYTLRKFVRRHRAAAVAVAAVTVTLVATAVVSTRLAWAARRAEARWQDEADTSRRLADFLREDLLASAAQQAQPVWDLRWRGVLERASASLEGRFRDRPQLESAVRATLAANYQTLGDFPAAQRQYELALALRRRAGAVCDRETLVLIEGLARAEESQGNFAAVEELWRQTLPLQRAAAGGDDVDTWRIEHRRAMALRRLAQHAEAQALVEKTLAARTRRLGPEHPDTLSSWQGLALVHFDAGRLAEAERCGALALAGLRRALGEAAPATLGALSSHATTLRFLGRHAEAEALYREALEVRTRVFGADHPETQVAVSELAFLYQDLGRYGEAAALTEREVAAKQRALGPEHPATLGAMNNLAFQRQLAGDPAAAAELHATVLELRRRVLGPNHAAVAQSLFGIGVARRLEGRLAEAEVRLGEAAALRTRLLGAEHRDTLRAREELGAALREQRKWIEAEAVLREVVAIQRRLAPASWEFLTASSQLGDVLGRMRQFAAGEVLLLEADAGFRRAAEAGGPIAIAGAKESARRLEQLYRAWGRPAEAATWTEERRRREP